MGNPFYRDGTAGGVASGTLNLTIPATTQPGDKLVISSVYKATTAVGIINTPAGWSVLQGPTQLTGATANGVLFVKDAVAADAGATVALTPSGGTQQNEGVMAVIGQAGSIRDSGWTDQGVTSSTSLSCGAETAAPSDLTLLCVAARGNSNGPAGSPNFSAPSGYTMRQQHTATSGSAQNVGTCIATGNVVAAQTITADVSSWAVTGQVIVTAESSSLGALGCG